MAEHQRKIELQSPEDLQYLISNVRRAANEKIEKDLPPLTLPEGQKDELKARVEELVYDYVTKVFQTAAPNISINGIDVNPSLISSSTSEKPIEVEEFEPIDSKLHGRARVLIAEEEELIEEIARLRREMPVLAVDKTRSEYKEGMESDELQVKEMLSLGTVEPLDVPPLERQEQVERNWDGGVRILQDMNLELSKTAAKTERAQKAGHYVLAPEKKS